MKVPKTLNDIPLRNYLKYREFCEGYDLEKGDQVFLQRKAVQYLFEIPLAVSSKMVIEDFNGLVLRLNEILGNEPKFAPRFKLNGQEFGFIPDLDNDFSLGEYSDFNDYIEDEQELNRIMAILYRPVTKRYKEKYLIEEYNGTSKYAETMLDMPTGIALGGLVFFCNLTRHLLRSIQEFSEQVVRDNPEAVLALEKDGVGISILLPSLTTIFSELTMLLRPTYIRL